MAVKRTMHAGTDRTQVTNREHVCACGQRFISEQRITRRLTAISSTGTSQGTHAHRIDNGGKQAENSPKTAVPCDSPILRGEGGCSVSGLTPDPSGTLSDPPVDPLQQVDRARAKRKGLVSYSPDFLRFWAAYPRKEAKGAAWKAWKVLQPEINAVVSALSWQTKSQGWTKESGMFIPLPASYLNARRWEDEPTKGPGARPVRPSTPPADIGSIIAKSRELEEAAERKRQEQLDKYNRDKQTAEAKEQNGRETHG